MPVYLLYILQLLDIGCFSPLKKAYSVLILDLTRWQITMLSKIKFLHAFKSAFISVFLEDTIKGAFRGSGPVLFNLKRVLEVLNMRLCTPIPPIKETTP